MNHRIGGQIRPYRVAIGAIFTECNHLGGVPIDVQRFEQFELYREDEITSIESGVRGGHVASAAPSACVFAMKTSISPFSD